MTPEFLLRELKGAQAKEVDCTFCWLERYSVQRYLTGVANDGVNNVPLRLKLAERGGYCPAHCAEFADIANPLSGAILLEAFLKRRLSRAAAGKRPRSPDCEACDVARSTERSFSKSVRQHRRSAELQTLLLELPLCLHHLERVSRQVPALRKPLSARHDDLRRDLAELIRKHDYRFSDESVSENEKKSIQRALELFGRR